MSFRITRISWLLLGPYYFGLCMLAGCSFEAKSQDELIGQPAYHFEIETLDGNTLSLADFRGKALILPIWDTTCAPCIREFPSFVELYKTYQRQGLEIVGLTPALYENPDGIRAFVKKHKLNYPNAIVSKWMLTRLGGIKGLPTTYLIGKNGLIYKRYLGYQSKDVFERDIKAMLN